MRHHQHWPLATVSVQPRDDGPAQGSRFEQLRVDASRAEHVGQVAREGQLVSGRISSVETNQALEMRDRLVASGIPIRRHGEKLATGRGLRQRAEGEKRKAELCAFALPS